MLYNLNVGMCLLGCLLKQPSLLTIPQYPLCKDDFEPVQFHKALYLCIQRLAREGVQEITGLEIENIAKNHTVIIEVLEDNNYIEFIETAKELATIDNYEYYYNTIRKYSLLRDLQADGFGITEFYDELQGEEKARSKIDSLTLQAILNKIELKSISLRSKYDVKYVRNEMWAGERTQELIDGFKETPSFGAFLSSQYLTQLFMGWNRGHLLMNSSPSGGMKTRTAVSDLCGVCVSEMWDDVAQDFLLNPNYQGHGLFIHTELDTYTEMFPIFLAKVSGVPEKHIKQGILTQEEEKRVQKAGQILLEDKLLISDMADFTAKSIERKIKESVEGYGMEYMVFDYVQLQSAIASEYRENTSVQAREDLVLKSLVTELKRMAEDYRVGILTMSQLNGNEKNMDFPDESCLSGAKSLKQKLDAGCITLPVKDRRKELKRVEPFIYKRGFGNETPNLISYVYKSRFGEYADQKIKVWRKFDGGIMQNIDFFCTDNYDEYVNIPIPQLEVD